MKKRKSLLTVLGTCTVACLASAFALLPVNATQAAADDKIAVTNVLMEEGAYVRLGNESTNQTYAVKSGLRFVMFVNKAYYDGLVSAGKTVEVGMYVAHENFYDAAKDNADLSDENSIPAYSRHVVMQNFDVVTSDVTTEEVYEFAVVQPDIAVKDYGDQLSANGYIKVDGAYTFASNVQTRSIAQTASNALLAGETNDGLKAFVDGVVTEDNFAIENTTVKTDLYKTAQPSLGEITLPANVTPIWTSSDTDVVAVDAQGNLTRGTKTGTATITATLGTKTKTATVSVTDPAPLIVDEDNYTNVFMYNGATTYSTYVPAESEEIAGFTGGYTGNAVKVSSGSGMTYELATLYTQEELEKIALSYNTVSFWLAPSGIEKTETGAGVQYFMHTDTLAYKMNNDNMSFTSVDNGVWRKITVTINDYIALSNEASQKAAYTQPVAKLFYLYTDGCKSTTQWYIGNVEFGFDPLLMQINSGTVNKSYEVFVTDGSSRTYKYLEAGNSETASFTGDYTGNAVRIPLQTWSWGPWNHAAPYLMASQYTGTQLKAYADKGYTHVALWFAVNGIETGDIGFGEIELSSVKYPNFLYQAGYGDVKLTSADNGKWQQVVIPIHVYDSLLSARTYTIDGKSVTRDYVSLLKPLNSTLADGTGDGAFQVYFYFGDMQLVKNASIIDVNSATASNIYNNNVASTYLAAGNEEIASFTGGYTGGAQRFSFANNREWKAKNLFTLEQLEALKGTYSNISLWIAMDNIGSGSASMKLSWNNNFLNKATSTKTNAYTAEDNGVWYKYTVSIDDYIDLITTTTDGVTTVNDSFYLFVSYPNSLTSTNGGASSLVKIYVGDIFFE